jgi:hypothetical protein
MCAVEGLQCDGMEADEDGSRTVSLLGGSWSVP